MSLFLLCDIVDFGKINLENLRTTRQWYNFIKKRPNVFTDASGLKPPLDLATDIIHDKVTHMKIPTKTVGKWLDKKVGSKTKQDTPFIALNKTDNWKGKSKYNALTEYIANGLEANNRSGAAGSVSYDEANQAYSIGRALRKKKLNNEQKILTNLAGAAATGDTTRIKLLKQITKKTEADPRDLQYAIDDFKDANGGNTRYYKKQRGSKQNTSTIEEKKGQLKQKYGIT